MDLVVEGPRVGWTPTLLMKSNKKELILTSNLTLWDKLKLKFGSSCLPTLFSSSPLLTTLPPSSLFPSSHLSIPFSPNPSLLIPYPHSSLHFIPFSTNSSPLISISCTILLFLAH